MKFKFFVFLYFLLIFSAEIFPQQIFKNSIRDYQISLLKNEKEQFVLDVSLRTKTLLHKIFPAIKLYFYNLDANPEDEMIVVGGSIVSGDTLNTLYVYTFEDKFKFCDSIQLGKYLPEFYQFDFEGNYFIKVYDMEIEKIFPSSRPELPFSFYYLNDCMLEFDNEYSFEEYEAEINFLVDEIYEQKRNFDCNDVGAKQDFQRLLACLYFDLFNSGKAFDFDNFLLKNYPCEDREEFQKKLNSILELSE